jgi:conjugal transfer mating pair stabilization protein TraG
VLFRSEHNRSLIDLSEHQAHQTSSGETHSTGTTASTNQSFQTLDNLVDRFAKDHSISKEKASQILAQVSASAEVGVGTGFLGFASASAKAGGTLSSSTTDSTSDRALLSAGEDYSKQSNFQNALSQASQAAHDLRLSDTTDTGKRYVSSLNASSERSHQFREEASASFQKSEAFSKMASWTQQNAGSINANLNQEYVNWLQTQALPNSKGAMGITEAETILSSRPGLDHSYQQRFLEQKMHQMEAQFGAYGLPNSVQEIGQSFRQAEQNLQASSPNQGPSALSTQAAQQGLGEAFKLNARPKNAAKEQLSLIQDQLAEQKETLEKQGQARKATVDEKTK